LTGFYPSQVFQRDKGAALAHLAIRPYQEQDEQTVVALWNESLAINAPHNDPVTSIRKKLEVDRELFLVATVEGLVAGTAMGGYDGHRGWIYTVAVAPDKRKLGIGRALIRRLEDELRNRGCLKINLQVRESNLEVMEFYRKLGYEKDPVVSMGKRLY
jgi:ribosomal protein S18 acetylase RimI-like enzyme